VVFAEDPARPGVLHQEGWPGRDSLTHADVARGLFPHFSSLVIRRELLPDLPHWMRDMHAADWVMSLLLSREGSIGLLDSTSSVYWQNAGSSWSPKPAIERKRAALRDARVAARNVAPLASSFRTYRADLHMRIAAYALQERKPLLAFWHATMMVARSPVFSLGEFAGRVFKRR
jgi:hypothetical protein